MFKCEDCKRYLVLVVEEGQYTTYDINDDGSLEFRDSDGCGQEIHLECYECGQKYEFDNDLMTVIDVPKLDWFGRGKLDLSDISVQKINKKQNSMGGEQLITINFFKDGAYVKGHDIPEICTNISYAMWCIINDCLEEDADVYYYESANDEQWKHLGFTYVKINMEVDVHKKIYSRFKQNLSEWVTVLFPNRVKIIEKMNDLIIWENALRDAKEEQV